MIKTRKFASENQDAAEVPQDMINVNLVDGEGNPVNEKELSESQIKFATKVAVGVYKKFATSKKVMFDSEEDSIEVKVPEEEEVEVTDPQTQVDEIVTEKEGVEGDPDEVIVEATITDPEDGDTFKVIGEADKVEEVKDVIENKKFSRNIHRFSAEDLEESDKVEDEVEDAVENIEEAEDKVNEQDSNPEKFMDVKEIPNKTFSSKKDKSFSYSVIDNVLGGDSIEAYKAKFFASQK